MFKNASSFRVFATSLVLSLFTTSVKSATELDLFFVDPLSNNLITDRSTLKKHLESNVVDREVVLSSDEIESVSFVLTSQKGAHIESISISPAPDASKSGIPAINYSMWYVLPWYQGCTPEDIHFKHCKSNIKKSLRPELLVKNPELIQVDTTLKRNKLKILHQNTIKWVDISDDSVMDGPGGRGPDLSLPAGAVVEDDATLQSVQIEKGQQIQVLADIGPFSVSQAQTIPMEIIVTYNGGKIRAFSFSLRLLPIDLADARFDYALFYRGRYDPREYDYIDSEVRNAERLMAEFRNMKKHGIENITVTQDYAENDSIKQKFDFFIKAKRGQGLHNDLFLLWTGKYFDNLELARSLLSHVKKEGVGKVYFFGGDELTINQMKEKERDWARIKQVGGLVFSTADPGYISESLDLYVVAKIRSREVIENLKNAGKEVYLYGEPQVGIEQPDTYRRNYGLVPWLLGYNGIMNYAYQDGWGSIWNDFDGYFRDHVFAYPTSNGVIGTLQMKGFREAVDDVRHIELLTMLLEDEKELGIVLASIQKMMEDGENMNKVRKYMRDVILENI